MSNSFIELTLFQGIFSIPFLLEKEWGSLCKHSFIPRTCSLNQPAQSFTMFRYMHKYQTPMNNNLLYAVWFFFVTFVITWPIITIICQLWVFTYSQIGDLVLCVTTQYQCLAHGVSSIKFAKNPFISSFIDCQTLKTLIESLENSGLVGKLNSKKNNYNTTGASVILEHSNQLMLVI